MQARETGRYTPGPRFDPLALARGSEAGASLRGSVADDLALDHEDDVFGDVGRLVGHALEVTGDREQLQELFPALRLVGDASKDELRGHVVVCPPSALNDRWSRRLPDPITAMASGWMRVRQRARQRNVELPLVISDHADWHELTRTIEEVDPQESWITHGREEALLRWHQLHQRKARALALVGYEDEDD